MIESANARHCFISEKSSDACDGHGNSGHQSDFARLAGGTIPFIRKYSTICP